MDITSDSIIAVIGAGTMGAGIAQVAAHGGHCVIVIDAEKSALNRGRAQIDSALSVLIQRGKITDPAKAQTLSRIRWSRDLADASNAALVIEAIVERLDAKTALFTKLTAMLPPSAIIATNTSSLSVETMAAVVDGPDRFLGLHFFNPVPAMALVEVIAARSTASWVIDGVVDLMRCWNKHPVQVRDVPGFIVNRVARPYYAEGFAALGEGLDANLIDYALTGAGGFRMGPLSLADMIGHDVNYVVAQSVFDAYDGATRFRPQLSQKTLFESGRLGRKAGSGVYDYAKPLPVPVLLLPGAHPDTITVGSGSVVLEPLITAAEKAGIKVTTTPDVPAETIYIGDLAMALGDGRPLADRPDVDLLLDYARNFTSTPLLVMTGHNLQALAFAAGFAAALGKSAISLPDRPGQIVLRTLAQLANAAADAVSDSIATDAGIDAAMRFGANHPEGPLEWAERTGHARVREALRHIANATNDPIYAAAGFFGQEVN